MRDIVTLSNYLSIIPSQTLDERFARFQPGPSPCLTTTSFCCVIDSQAQEAGGKAMNILLDFGWRDGL